MAIIRGTDGSDVLVGTSDGDYLVGGAGADTMSGGAGDDTYYVDDSGDVVNEAPGQGRDRVAASVSYALAAGAEVEILEAITLTATDALNLSGNEFSNQIIGNDGVNILMGGGGNDLLAGLGGNDFLLGGSGLDLLLGGAGNDTYYIDDAGDVASENAGEGYDRVAALVSYTLPAGSEIELLEAITLSATNPLNLTGNEYGNTIYGNAGNNVLDGGSGADVLVGFGGDDAYLVDNANDRVYESANQGFDAVYAGVSYQLPSGQHIEMLSIHNRSGTGPVNFTGNEYDNIIRVDELGGFRIDGGLGNDTISIGLTDDVFVTANVIAFTTALNGATNVDSIPNFYPAFDTMSLAGGGAGPFAALPLGALAASAFTIGTSATTAQHRIIYNSTTGGILYDPDGSGGQAAIQFATIYPGLVNFGAKNFIVEAPPNASAGEASSSKAIALNALEAALAGPDGPPELTLVEQASFAGIAMGAFAQLVVQDVAYPFDRMGGHQVLLPEIA